MKSFKSIILPCLDFFTRAIDEIKDAFPFFWCKRINGIVHTPWEMSNGILKTELNPSGLAIPTLEEIIHKLDEACEGAGIDDHLKEIIKDHTINIHEASYSLIEDISNMKKTMNGNHFSGLRRLVAWGSMAGVNRFPFEPNWLFRKRITKSITRINKP